MDLADAAAARQVAAEVAKQHPVRYLVNNAGANRPGPLGQATAEDLDYVIDSIPVKRVGTPDDIARAVLFLLSPDSGYIAGQTLFVCGGASVSGSGGD